MRTEQRQTDLIWIPRQQPSVVKREAKARWTPQSSVGANPNAFGWLEGSEAGSLSLHPSKNQDDPNQRIQK